MNLRHRKYSGLLLAALLLTGCQQTPSTTAPGSTDTVIASTTPSLTATSLPAAPTPTPTFSPTSSLIPTHPVQPAAGDFAIVFVGETVPDGTNLKPGQAFQKTWTLKNGGVYAWTEGFALAKTTSSPEGENLGSPETIPLAREVQPGETIQIKVDLAAPQ